MCSFAPIQFLNNFWCWSSFYEFIGLDCGMRRWGFTSWSFLKMEVFWYKPKGHTSSEFCRINLSVKRILFSRKFFYNIRLSSALSTHETGASHSQSTGLQFLAAVRGSQQEFRKIWLRSIQLALAWGRLVGFRCRLQLLLSHSALNCGLGGRGFGAQWSWAGKSGRDLMRERRRM